jgi:hypothetical protein
MSAAAHFIVPVTPSPVLSAPPIAGTHMVSRRNS